MTCIHYPVLLFCTICIFTLYIIYCVYFALTFCFILFCLLTSLTTHSFSDWPFLWLANLRLLHFDLLLSYLTTHSLIPYSDSYSCKFSFYKTVCGIGYIFARVTGALSPPGGEFLPEREVETLLAGPQSIFLLNSWMVLLISLSLPLSFFYFSTLCLHQHWYISYNSICIFCRIWPIHSPLGYVRVPCAALLFIIWIYPFFFGWI